MNLLITNSQEIQTYVILRSLRAEAKRIIVTRGGDSVGSNGLAGMTVFSKFVDATYEVPNFAADWLAGRLEPENTASEEAYIQRIEEICRREAVDVIFPSLDPEVYLFAKNKKRLADRGVLTVVPEPEVVCVPMDKARTIRAAQSAGFPCPKTYYPESLADLARVRRDSDPPWIVKARQTAHMALIEYAESPADLDAVFMRISRLQSAPIVQEFVGGASSRNYYVTVNRESEVISLFSPDIDTTFDNHRTRSRSCISGSTGPYLDELRAMIRELRLWGGYTIQTLIDPKDGKPKLMEINARLGHHVWWRTVLDVNEPLILLQMARGESPTGNFEFPNGVMLLDPYQDLFLLYHRLLSRAFRAARRMRRTIHRGKSVDSNDEPPVEVLRLLRIYGRDYFNRRPKRFGPEFSSVLSDPYACLRVFWDNFWFVTCSWFRRSGDRSETTSG